MLTNEDVLLLAKDKVCEAAQAAANGWQSTRWDEVRTMKELKRALSELKELKLAMAERRQDK